MNVDNLSTGQPSSDSSGLRFPVSPIIPSAGAQEPTLDVRARRAARQPTKISRKSPPAPSAWVDRGGGFATIRDPLQLRLWRPSLTSEQLERREDAPAPGLITMGRR